MEGESRFYRNLCILTMVVCAFLLVKLGISSGLENTRILMPEAGELCSGWYYMEGNAKMTVTLPFITDADRMIFYFDLPDLGSREQILFFGNNRQKVTVQLDGKSIYHFGTVGAYWGNALPDIDCVVPVGVQDGTHQISVQLEGGVGRKVVFLPVKIGSEGEVLAGILRELSGVLLFSVIMISFGLILIGVSGTMLFKRREGIGELFLHAGMFIFVISIWILTDEPVLQLVIGNVETVFMLSFLCFMLIPVPMLSFVECICGRKYRGTLILKYLLLANLLMQTLLHAAAEIDYYLMLPFTHLLIAGSIFCMIYYLYREYRQKKAFYAKGILGAILIFLVCVTFALLDFYGEQRYYSLWIRTGIVVYSIVLILLSIKKMLLMEEERTRSAVYKSLAFVDVMTACGNRAAFENRLRSSVEGRKGKESVCLAIVDVNGLKYINDTRGHLDGDAIIKGTASCLQKAFAGMGEVFRIGGDEFAVVLRNCEEALQELQNRLDRCVENYNKEHEIPLSLACGIAKAREDGGMNSIIEELYREADRLMYAEKRESLLARDSFS